MSQIFKRNPRASIVIAIVLFIVITIATIILYRLLPTEKLLVYKPKNSVPIYTLFDIVKEKIKDTEHDDLYIQGDNIIIALPASEDPKLLQTALLTNDSLEFQENIGGQWISSSLNGTDVDSVGLHFDEDHNNQPTVLITFTATGADILSDLTKRNLNKAIRVVLNGKVIFSPTGTSEITGGKIIIYKPEISLFDVRELAVRVSAVHMDNLIEFVGEKTERNIRKIFP